MTQFVVRSATPPGLPALVSPAGMLRNLWSHRDLIRQFTVRMFVARFKGTQLGLLWAVLVPFTMLAVYTFVFNTVLKTRWPGETDDSLLAFATFLFCGMTVYSIFSESVTRAPHLVLENPNFVKKVVFPLEVLPVASLGSSLLYASCGMLIVVASAMFVKGLAWTALLFPLVLLPMVLLALGLGWFLASLGVFMRDVGNVVGIFVGQILFFLTPVLYPSERLGDLRIVADLNPLTCVIDGARKTLLQHELPDWPALAVATAVSLVVVVLGYAFFMKSKRSFADVL